MIEFFFKNRMLTSIPFSFSRIVAIGFWFIVLCLVLAFWGMDSLLFFLSLASIILVFAFTISSAISKYIEVREANIAVDLESLC